MQINSYNSKIFITEEPDSELEQAIREIDPDKIFVIVDRNTKKYCLPLLPKLKTNQKVQLIETGQGEKNKNLESVVHIWNKLTVNLAGRNSLIINLGGGLLSDMGGFAASAFKRGIRFINVPTTLLSMVDASVGGKVGVNFMHLKNHIGVFNSPGMVFISSSFLRTLPERQLYAGWAEMIKHGLIHSPSHLFNLLETSPEELGKDRLNEFIFESISIKNYFVTNDPFEKNIRKALNFGHTLGHAFESLSQDMSTPLLHGEAIANGMLCELFLSVEKSGFQEKEFERIKEYIQKYYPIFNADVKLVRTVLDIARQDKKNRGEKVNFTLLEGAGNYSLDQYVEEALIEKSLKQIMSTA